MESAELRRTAERSEVTGYRDWLLLLKPRVLSLVAFSGLVGLLAAPGHVNPITGCIAIFCILTGAGACGAINMWYDQDIDAVMRRTKNRPIVAGRVSPSGALAYGIVLAILSVIVMGTAVNIPTAIILAISIAFYVFIYTMWLKRRTPQNIVIGGAAGAFPPMIGWAAVTGSVDLMPIILFTIIFVWTPPHFWSLALWANDDYRAAGVPMLPVVAGAKETRRQIMLYTVALVPVTLVPCFLGFSHWLYAVTAVVLGGIFLWGSYKVLVDQQDAGGNSLTRDKPARSNFKFSILYLFILFAMFALDRVVLG